MKIKGEINMKKIKVMILFIVLGILLIIPNSAHAGYQSKPGEALTQKTPDVYFAGCRQMETSGGVSGLFGFTYYDGRITTWRSCCCCLWCRPLR